MASSASVASLVIAVETGLSDEEGSMDRPHMGAKSWEQPSRTEPEPGQTKQDLIEPEGPERLEPSDINVLTAWFWIRPIWSRTTRLDWVWILGADPLKGSGRVSVFTFDRSWFFIPTPPGSVPRWSSWFRQQNPIIPDRTHPSGFSRVLSQRVSPCSGSGSPDSDRLSLTFCIVWLKDFDLNRTLIDPAVLLLQYWRPASLVRVGLLLDLWPFLSFGFNSSSVVSGAMQESTKFYLKPEAQMKGRRRRCCLDLWIGTRTKPGANVEFLNSPSLLNFGFHHRNSWCFWTTAGFLWSQNPVVFRVRSHWKFLIEPVWPPWISCSFWSKFHLVLFKPVLYYLNIQIISQTFKMWCRNLWLFEPFLIPSAPLMLCVY